MKTSHFKMLLKGVHEAGEFARGERLPARVTVAGGNMVKGFRETLHLSQAEFARLLSVQIGTLRSWEQGRSVPRALPSSH